jgi:hypothetical protein
VGVLAARNLLLVAATVLAILRLRGGPRSMGRRRDAGHRDPAVREDRDVPGALRQHLR